MNAQTTGATKTVAFKLSAVAAASLLLQIPHVFAADAVSYKTQIQPIFNAQCVFCHVTGAENGGLNLARALSYQNLVSAPSTESTLLRVAPGKPDESYLMHKLLGTHLSVGGTGDAMPRTDPPRHLEQEQLDLFKLWIEQGAPKD